MLEVLVIGMYWNGRLPSCGGDESENLIASKKLGLLFKIISFLPILFPEIIIEYSSLNFR
jgi:hypothetical protein